ncbi:ABC transporter substrate-binding protein [Brevibacillus massiliensis]|uniref:ABC transporter substrate-binding protein n=1 Tax=Brevibacillus massiliensis TaxID=1118054 RepID=UPI00030387E7|nr:ABC transporter substrate-binding protein [Brevibacillus massiliensis]
MTKAGFSKRLLWALLAVATAMCGCAPGQNQVYDQTPAAASATKNHQAAAASHDGKELVIGSPGSLPAFDPFGQTKQEARLTPLEFLAYRGLLAASEEEGYTAALAAGYTVEREDGKPSIVVKLRESGTWPDGSPITADDVLFTLETYARPEYYGVWRQAMGQVKGVSAYRSGQAEHISGITVDTARKAVRIALDRDDMRFFRTLTAPLLSRNQLAGKTVKEIDELSQAGRLLGAGPFQPVQLSPREWRFAANPSYCEGKPVLDAIRVRPVEPVGMADELAAGTVDWSPVPPDMASRLAGAAEVKAGRGNGYQFLGFNLESGPLADIGVRRALAQAISAGQIAKDVCYGYAEPALGPVSPSSFAYAPGGLPRRDRAGAAKTLSAKGFSAKNPLTLTLVYPAENRVRERLLHSLIRSWADLPVRIVTKPLPPKEFVSYIFGGNPFDLYLYGWRYPADPGELSKLWHSGEKVGELGLNASRYANSRADKLLEKGRLILPLSERKELFAQWQRLFAADLPIVPLVEVKQPYFVSSRLHLPDEQWGTQPFRTVHKWRLD